MKLALVSVDTMAPEIAFRTYGVSQACEVFACLGVIGLVSFSACYVLDMVRRVF